MGFFGHCGQAIASKFSTGDGLSAMAGAVAGGVEAYKPLAKPVIDAHMWTIPLASFAAVLLWRVVSSPYHAWKAANDRAVLAEQRLAAPAFVIQQQLANYRANCYQEIVDILSEITVSLYSGYNIPDAKTVRFSALTVQLAFDDKLNELVNKFLEALPDQENQYAKARFVGQDIIQHVHAIKPD